MDYTEILTEMVVDVCLKRTVYTIKGVGANELKVYVSTADEHSGYLPIKQ